jgi:hypothetical protein
MQRRAWFELGPEVSSPDEDVNQFADDSAFEEFLAREDNGLNADQLATGRRLFGLVKRFADETPQHLEPTEVIDDPRWKQIRVAAREFLDIWGWTPPPETQ